MSRSTRAKALVARFDAAGDRLLVRARRHRSINRVMYTASEIGNHSLIWHLVGTGMALRPGQPPNAAIRTSALLGLESALVNGPIKMLFRRTRPLPPAVERPHLLRQPRTSSFPSGHASAAFCFVAMADPSDPLRPALGVAATVVALSRAHVQIHHASDVAGGVLTGLLLGRLFRAWWPPSDSGPRWPVRAPATHGG